MPRLFQITSESHWTVQLADAVREAQDGHIIYVTSEGRAKTARAALRIAGKTGVTIAVQQVDPGDGDTDDQYKEEDD